MAINLHIPSDWSGKKGNAQVTSGAPILPDPPWFSLEAQLLPVAVMCHEEAPWESWHVLCKTKNNTFII